MSCEFHQSGGAYLLGALSPAERTAFEGHLPTCPDCAAVVRELAGLPGLLARVDPSVLEPASADEPLQQTLLPALADAVRRERRGRTWRTAALAAAAAAVTVGFASWAVAGTGDGGSPPRATPTSPTSAPSAGASSAVPAVPEGREMVPVADTTMRAQVSLEQVPWGTRLDLTCSYLEASEYGTGQIAPYSLVVRTRDGRAQRVATWRPLAGRTMQLSAATATATDEIAWVELRSSDGTPVLRLGT